MVAPAGMLPDLVRGVCVDLIDATIWFFSVCGRAAVRIPGGMQHWNPAPQAMVDFIIKHYTLRYRDSHRRRDTTSH